LNRQQSEPALYLRPHGSLISHTGHAAASRTVFLSIYLLYTY
jgi:hypothetical protein